MMIATMPKFSAMAQSTPSPVWRKTIMNGTVTITVRARAAALRCMRQNTQPITVIDMKKATCMRAAVSP